MFQLRLWNGYKSVLEQWQRHIFKSMGMITVRRTRVNMKMMTC